MDLLRIFEAAGHARELVRIASGQPAPAWTTDQEAFGRHFGVPLETYQEIASRLSPEQAELLERTLEVNPEAAVLWVLAMEEVG